MGFLRDQRTKWRARHHSSCESDTSAQRSPPASSLSTPVTPAELVAFPYSGGPLGLTLQRSKSQWVDDLGPTKLTWNKDRRLGITFHEKPARTPGGVDRVIAIKELGDDARSHPAVCVGMELIGVNGEPIAGLELSTVMDIVRSSKAPCELAFTPPPSPILVAEVLSAAAAARGVASGHVLVAVDDLPMLGCSLQDASDAIGAASPDSPVTLRFAPLDVVFQGRGAAESPPRSNDVVKRSLRNTLCIAAVTAALAV